MADNRPVAIAGAATPSEQHRISFDGRFQSHTGKRAAMRALFGDPQSNRSFGTHINDHLGVLAALRFMRFVVIATLGIKRFALTMERGRYSVAEMSRFGQKIIEAP